MNYLNSMRVSARLTAGFGLLIAALIAVSILALSSLNTIHDQLEELIQNRMVKVRLFTEIKEDLNTVARITRSVALITDVPTATVEANKLPPLRAQISKNLAELDKTVVDPRGKELLKLIKETRPGFDQHTDAAIKLGLTGKPEDAEAATKIMFGDMRVKQDLLFKAVDDSLAMQQAFSTAIGDKAGKTVSSSTFLLSMIAATASLLGILLAWAIARGLGRQLGAEPQELAQAMAHVADGDLSSRLRLREGDTGSVMAAVQRMQTALAGVVSTVRQGSEAVASASTQIAQGNQDLSQRTEEQASALEQTAASMEQLGSTVTQNADNAKQANQLALNASSVAIQGGEVVSQVVGTMRGISDSSRKIADIIGVIDGIAFQTNILALNAAVEAARAGEQGRGFAVVASEVRSLAQRSAEAAKEIKTLITDSVERVEQGTALVDQAGATMNEVVSSIRRVTDIMGEISAASTEQSAGVGQVGSAVTEMDRVTQQNAALVEEMAAATTSLSSQAQDLVRAVAVFKIDHAAEAAGARPVLRQTAKAAAVAAVAAARKPAPKPALKAVQPTQRPSQPKPTVAPAPQPALATADDGDDWTNF